MYCNDLLDNCIILNEKCDRLPGKAEQNALFHSAVEGSGRNC